MSCFSFPVLSMSELVSWLANLERPVPPLTSADLCNPTFKNVQVIYYQFVEMLMGVSVEALQQPTFEHMEALGPHPQLHEQSIVESAMVKALCNLMQVVGVSDFTYRDLVYPEKKRTVRNFSAIINFAKFRQDRLETFHEFLEQTEELKAEKQTLEERNEALQAQKRALEKARQAEAPEIARLTSETEEMATRLSKLNKAAQDMRKDIKEEKQRIQRLNDSNDSDKFIVLQHRNDIEKLSAQVVRSPERLKRVLVSMSDGVEADKREIEETLLSIRHMEAKEGQLSKAQGRIRKRIETMSDIAELLQKCKKLSKEIKESTNEVIANEDAIGELVREERYLKEQIDKSSEKLFKLQKQFEKKRTSADLALADVQAAKTQLDERLAEQHAAVQQNQADIDAKKAEMEVVKATHVQQMAMLREKYTALSFALADYHARLRAAIASAAPGDADDRERGEATTA